MREAVEPVPFCRIELPVFSGPLDLLLHLVEQEQVDIYDIPVARITEQYLQYLAVMQEQELNLAADFLVMAATLVQIKARLLLPKPVSSDGAEDNEEDPRAELVRQLVEYRRYKESAGLLADLLASQNRAFGRVRQIEGDPPDRIRDLPDGDLAALVDAYRSLLAEVQAMPPSHQVRAELFNVEEKMNDILDTIRNSRYMVFSDLFRGVRSRDEVIATFLAVLELVRLGMVVVRQEKALARLELFAGPSLSVDALQ